MIKRFPLKSGAFTIVEMLAATMLVTILMSAILLVLGGITRDRRRVVMDENSAVAAQARPLVGMLRWDLVNASAMTPMDHGRVLVLVGNGGLDGRTFAPNGRLARVVYRVINDGAGTRLIREQAYLDDAVRPEPWTELAARGVTRLSVIPSSSDAEVVHGDDEALSQFPVAALRATSGRNNATIDGRITRRVPTRVRLRVEFTNGTIDEELWTR
jgi:hypothetical protein